VELHPGRLPRRPRTRLARLEELKHSVPSSNGAQKPRQAVVMADGVRVLLPSRRVQRAGDDMFNSVYRLVGITNQLGAYSVLTHGRPRCQQGIGNHHDYASWRFRRCRDGALKPRGLYCILYVSSNTPDAMLPMPRLGFHVASHSLFSIT
jgi:hypothetical protein